MRSYNFYTRTFRQKVKQNIGTDACDNIAALQDLDCSAVCGAAIKQEPVYGVGEFTFDVNLIATKFYASKDIYLVQ